MTRLAATIFFLSLAAVSATSSSAFAEKQAAIFAGGCFWCVEADFDKVPGVISTVSGYTGGSTDNPTYENHSAAKHREVVRIEFDDAKVSYEKLLDVFWHSVDPTDRGGQFCDRGHSYTTAIYAVGAEQQAQAQSSKAAAEKELGSAIVTPISAAPKFWPAEEYHQDYYKKNPIRYRYYRGGCGRDDRIKQVWGEAAFQGMPGH